MSLWYNRPMKKEKKELDFLAQLMGNPARARILRALVVNENEVFTDHRLGKLAAVSLVVVRKECAALQRIGLVRRGKAVVEDSSAPVVTKKKPEDVWFLDPQSRHQRALGVFVREISPVRYEHVLDALRRGGRLSTVVLSGSFIGDVSRPADIVIAADSLNERKLESAIRALENIFGRELRYASFSTPEFRYRLTVQDRLLRDTLDYPHLVLLDRGQVLS